MVRRRTDPAGLVGYWRGYAAKAQTPQEEFRLRCDVILAMAAAFGRAGDEVAADGLRQEAADALAEVFEVFAGHLSHQQPGSHAGALSPPPGDEAADLKPPRRIGVLRLHAYIRAHAIHDGD